ncbi:hypothetical protein SAMN05216548_11435 [Faunimonas pinastri]|uniref:Uncharacterized protein n=1 Tax=Faunimonas pinastri TaxID=1855383 RepID=A0A1H9MSX1_9HYPH|nr:hypothetical protein [Faunimonas pinastri]SER26772.1 hypothetical protein SAMN05216548_11435 [Faunimonas pinastri]
MSSRITLVAPSVITRAADYIEFMDSSFEIVFGVRQTAEQELLCDRARDQWAKLWVRFERACPEGITMQDVREQARRLISERKRERVAILRRRSKTQRANDAAAALAIEMGLNVAI